MKKRLRLLNPHLDPKLSNLFLADPFLETRLASRYEARLGDIVDASVERQMTWNPIDIASPSEGGVQEDRK